MPDKVVFPYDNMTDAIEDRFRRVGGTDQAFRLLRHGFKTAEWRRRWEKKRREQELRDDAEFMAQNKGRTGFARMHADARKER